MAEFYYNLGLAFERAARENSAHPSLCYSSGNVSYEDLNSLSNQIACFLVDKNIGVSDVVAVFNTKTPIGYASMIACLKVGAIYTNIDEENPPERLKRILNTCQPGFVIFDHKPAEDVIRNMSDMTETISSELKWSLVITRPISCLLPDRPALLKGY